MADIRLAYRIQKSRHLATALTGEGARLTGGRWNPVGTPLVYASTTPELAFLENMVHLDGTPLADLPPYLLLTLALPADLIEDLAPADLPTGWDQRLYPDTVPQFLLPRLADPAAALAFAVPSVVLPATPSRNLLLNPRHPAIAQVQLLHHEPLPFDERLRP